MTTPPDWGDVVRRLVDGVRGMLAEPARATEDMGHGKDCRWCPLCQAIAMARGERPEVSAALADLLTTTAAALRAAAESSTAAAATPSDAAGDAEGADPYADQPTDESGEPPPEVQRIEIA